MLNYKSLIEPEDFIKECQNKANVLESLGKFNEDVNENSMGNAIPIDENFIFINKGIKFHIKKALYLCIMKHHTNKIANYLNFKVVGKDYLKELKNKPAIITCNHISLFDSFAVRYAIGMDIMYVAAEYNNWKGKMGEFARHTGYLPITNKLKYIRKFNEALEYYLNKKHKKILFYPEQSLWRQYTKPRPFKNGAFFYATKHNVPIIPLFVTLTDSGQKDEGGKIFHFSINILKPIYPKNNLSNHDNIEYMKQKNFNQTKTCYENFYNTKLSYTTNHSEV